MNNILDIKGGDISRDINKIEILLRLRLYTTDPLTLEEQIKKLELKNTDYMLQLLRAGGFDEYIQEIQTINNN